MATYLHNWIRVRTFTSAISSVSRGRKQEATENELAPIDHGDVYDETQKLTHHQTVKKGRKCYVTAESHIV